MARIKETTEAESVLAAIEDARKELGPLILALNTAKQAAKETKEEYERGIARLLHLTAIRLEEHPLLDSVDDEE